VEKNISLGSTVKDSLTDFSGVVVARIESLNKSPEVQVQPDLVRNGRPEDPTWLDESRVNVVEEPRYGVGFTPPAGSGSARNRAEQMP